MAAVDRLPVLQISCADKIFISFEIIGPIVVDLKMRVLLMYTLEGASSVVNLTTAYEESQ